MPIQKNTIYEVRDKFNDVLVCYINPGDGSTMLVQWGGKGEWEDYPDGLAMLLWPQDMGFKVLEKGAA